MDTTPSQNKTVYFPNLDGFRTIAFLIVFLGHCFILFDFGERTVVIKYLSKFFAKPGIGVHFFFVLSGFLISYLLLSEHLKHGKIRIGAFYMRRVLRIWPVYFLVILICCLLSFINRPFYSLHDASFGLITTFLTNFNLAGKGISSLPLTVLWSVAVEEQFYLFLPLLIKLFGIRVFYAFPLFIIGAVTYGVIHTHNIALVEFSTFSVCSSLFIGCISAYLVLFLNLSLFFMRIKKIVIISVYLAFFILHIYRDKIFSAEKSNVWLYFIDALFFAFFILEQNYAKNSFFKMSNFKLFTSSGKYTYGLYAYHMIFITLLLLLVPGVTSPAGNYFAYFSFWVAALLLSYFFSRLSYSQMEKPFLKLKEKFSP